MKRRKRLEIGSLAGVALLVMAAAGFAPTASAQRFGRTGAHGAGHAAFARFGYARRTPSNWLIGPYFYSADDYYGQPEVIEAPAPQIIVVPAAQPTVAPVSTKPAESLVLELHGDRWVRVTNHGDSVADEESTGSREVSNISSSQAIPTRPLSVRQATEANPESKLPAAVLVFRDGHREEIEKYAIVGATIYTSTDYWRSGAWSRSVNLADLDVPATLRANQESGSNFRLPTRPSEVMIRP